MEISDTRITVLTNDRGRFVSRTIVDDDELPMRISLIKYALDASSDEPFVVISRRNNANKRIGGVTHELDSFYAVTSDGLGLRRSLSRGFFRDLIPVPSRWINKPTRQ